MAMLLGRRILTTRTRFRGLVQHNLLLQTHGRGNSALLLYKYRTIERLNFLLKITLSIGINDRSPFKITVVAYIIQVNS